MPRRMVCYNDRIVAEIIDEAFEDGVPEPPVWNFTWRDDTLAPEERVAVPPPYGTLTRVFWSHDLEVWNAFIHRGNPVAAFRWSRLFRAPEIAQEMRLVAALDRVLTDARVEDELSPAVKLKLAGYAQFLRDKNIV